MCYFVQSLSLQFICGFKIIFRTLYCFPTRMSNWTKEAFLKKMWPHQLAILLNFGLFNLEHENLLHTKWVSAKLGNAFWSPCLFLPLSLIFTFTTCCTYTWTVAIKQGHLNIKDCRPSPQGVISNNPLEMLHTWKFSHSQVNLFDSWWRTSLLAEILMYQRDRS